MWPRNARRHQRNPVAWVDERILQADRLAVEENNLHLVAANAELVQQIVAGGFAIQFEGRGGCSTTAP